MPPKRQALHVALAGLQHLHPRLYMPLFQAVPELQVTAVAETDRALRESFAADFGLRAYASLDDMLNREALDIAAIFLPHVDCPDAAVLCARKGLHLMVEKPVAADVKGAERIARAAVKLGVMMTTGYCWRLHPAAREMKRLITAGAIGRVIGGEGRCAAGRLERYTKGGAGWMLERAKAGGGPMFNLGVHWIDLFRWLLADEVAEVSGRNLHVNNRYDIEDNSFAHLRFSQGAIVALDISYTVPDAYPNSRDLFIAVRGTRGTLAWSPAFEGQRDVLNICSDAPEFAGAPVRSQTFELAATPGYAGAMGLEYVRGFARAILQSGTPSITAADAVAALRIVEAIYQAANERRWIEIRR